MPAQISPAGYSRSWYLPVLFRGAANLFYTYRIESIVKLQLLVAILIVGIVHSVIVCQNDGGNDPVDIALPENIRREIVSRILIFKFKPARRPKVVHLVGEGISDSWLPSIRNVQFRLLSGEELADREAGVFFFTKPDLDGEAYNIGFAFGDLDCDYVGDGWRFRVSNNKLRLWYAGAIGGVCGGTGEEFKSAGKLNTYPNELEGFTFFDKGKLQGLKLSISTREDVKSRFGAECRSTCDYDQNWDISFQYFNDFHREATTDGRRVKIIPKGVYEDKIYSISLRPKKELLFDEVVFPRLFIRAYGISASHDGKGGGTNKSYMKYRDRYGLEYSVLDRISLTTESNLKWRKGQLIAIEYKIPEKFEEPMFTHQEQ